MHPYIFLEVCFRGRVHQFPNDPTQAFTRLQDWMTQPGTEWVKVKIDGQQVFEWHRSLS